MQDFKIINEFTIQSKISLPIIMAPMFLISNEQMMQAAIRNGMMGVFPTLNFREEGELSDLIKRLKDFQRNNLNFKGNFGVNLIVQRSNPLYEKHLEICIENKVDFYITSLGSPKQVIEKAHKYGGIVYCDVTNIEHANKCNSLNCDGFIAVGQGAGGHAGPNPLQVLVPSLKNHFPKKPIIAAGGIASGEGIISSLALGAQGVSIGTRFIASMEAGVNNEYKMGVVNATMDDIVLTERISGTPCTIINTDYAKKIGYKQNWFEKLLNKNNTTRKYFKMLTQVRGMKKLSNSVKPGSYDNLWCAGKSVELINEIQSIDVITENLINESKLTIQNLKNLI